MWVLGNAVYQGAHCISEERLGALYISRQISLTSEWLSWRNTDITCGSFGPFLIAGSWSRAHCSNPLFCTALSHYLHSIKVYANYHLKLYIFAVLLNFQFNFFQNHSFQSQPNSFADVYRDKSSCIMQTISKKSQEVELCSSYPYGPESVPSWCCTTVIPSLFLLQHILTRFYMHAASMDGWINFITWSGIQWSRGPEGPFCPKEKYLYLDHLWKICVLILLKIVSEEDPTNSAYCLCYVSFIF